MRDKLGPGTMLGYCTNVHAGASWSEIRENLEKHTLAVKKSVSPDEPMGIGLWLPEGAAREILAEDLIPEVRGWLGERGLEVFTLNGFPQRDFHQEEVKHKVYLPHWGEEARLCYTRDLVEILTGLLPEGGEGSISTLPLGWPDAFPDDESLHQAARNLISLADELHVIEEETGHVIHLDLEPEPGCVLQRSMDVVSFFKKHLGDGKRDEVIRRYIRVCHDICHAAVMFENQGKALKRYEKAGILVGKVQISSAVRFSVETLDPRDCREALIELSEFMESRYLHQTVWRDYGGSQKVYDDLHDAYDGASIFGPDYLPGYEWRVHFHVPVYLERIGLLGTSRSDIRKVLKYCRHNPGVMHFEMETYAWGVLPPELQVEPLSKGIARELEWVMNEVAAL